ncbi:hypothetical protein AKJ51_03475 [candidate division MSBL1 archaeon SCGC-AAA382A20]|uniref:Uncharacterized protein n=1 Tax=candidate division MSBL1 archaeon SCGC-AAA382A20 TaxID=1698280 RepID=A0A133VJE3_9EURY|nr:hypothetical protein AKJ51_03475 [candidate division MSBL1 archaeon SCGC-AAA382A20]
MYLNHNVIKLCFLSWVGAQDEESKEKGFLEWLYDRKKPSVREIRIVHHFKNSPIAKEKGTKTHRSGPSCYQHRNKEDRQDMHLNHFTGSEGLWSLNDEFLIHKNGVEVEEWAEICKRLHIPYYEEARLYFDMAGKDGYWPSTNDFGESTINTLKAIIEKYS